MQILMVQNIFRIDKTGLYTIMRHTHVIKKKLLYRKIQRLIMYYLKFITNTANILIPL